MPSDGKGERPEAVAGMGRKKVGIHEVGVPRSQVATAERNQNQNQNQNRFIRSYYRPRRPPLRPIWSLSQRPPGKNIYT